jgi:hypothetical protein
MKGKLAIWVLGGVVLLAAAVWAGRTYGPALSAQLGGAKPATNAAAATNAKPGSRIAGADAKRTTDGPPRLGAPQPVKAKPGTPTPAPVQPGKKPGQVIVAQPGLKPGGTNVASAPMLGTNANTLARLTQTLRQLPSKRAFYPVVGGIALCVAVVLLILVLKSSKKVPETEAAAKPGAKSARRKRVKVHSCNVLAPGGEGRKVWQFDAQNNSFTLSREQAVATGERLPARLAKDWRALWQPKLNIAWLPPEQAFLRVVQLPQIEFGETVTMLELQLEKLSPIPVAQVVWSIQVLPHADGKMQTVILLMAARSAVEEFLGRLEGEGYLADRLELPLVDQLCASPITGDGAWIYPEALGGHNTAVVAWWYGGVLQNLDLISVQVGKAGGLREQMLQSAWAGELDGWLTKPPAWHLVASGAVAAEWERPLREALEEPLEITASLPPAELAALTAKRAALADPKVNLLPAEFATRYQQQLVDRLWMRGLLAIGGIYLVGLAIYWVALSVIEYRVKGVERQIAGLSPQFTNALQLKAQYEVLKERQVLEFAPLDCWRAIAELMGSDLTLDTMNLSDGKRLMLNGTAPSDKIQAVYDFEAALRKATNTNGPLFVLESGDHTQYNMNPGSGMLSWHFSVELK